MYREIARGMQLMKDMQRWQAEENRTNFIANTKYTKPSNKKKRNRRKKR